MRRGRHPQANADGARVSTHRGRESDNQDEKSLNRLTVINAFESETSSENGRHVRNGSPCVMFVKNVWHPTVVKFVDSESSNGCGNGAGS